MGILDKIIQENKTRKEETVKTKEYSLIGSKCPHCEDGKMYPRQSRFGDFLGCSNFPRCAYTIRLEHDNDIGSVGYKEPKDSFGNF